LEDQGSKDMKLVINRCFGGFGLSIPAILELHKRGCKHIEVQDEKEYWKGDKDTVTERKKFAKITETPWVAKKVYIDLHAPEFEHRTCQHLIDLIEEWGADKVQGSHAELIVVRVPDSLPTNFYIDERDGWETVHENHGVWPAE